MDVSTRGQSNRHDFLRKCSSQVFTTASSATSATSSATSTQAATPALQDPRVSSQPGRPKTQSSLVGQKSVSTVLLPILWRFSSVRQLKTVLVGLSEGIPIDCT